MQLDHAITKAVRVLLLQRGIAIGSISKKVGMGNQSVINLLGNRNKWTMKKLERFGLMLDIEPWKIVARGEEIKEADEL